MPSRKWFLKNYCYNIIEIISFNQGLLCKDDICELGTCSLDEDCGKPAACIDGFCSLNCLKDSDCSNGLICKKSRCVPCEKNSDCPGVSRINVLLRVLLPR